MKKTIVVFGTLLFCLVFCLTNSSAQQSTSKQSDIAVSKGAPVYFPQPPYPDEVREKKISGKVKVQVLIDEKGEIISARAVSGHRLLRPAAEKAAATAKFTPTLKNGTPVKARAVLSYKFTY